MLEQMFGACRGQREGLDEFDLEAMQAGNAIRAFREFRMERACSKSQMKRGVLRGSRGASDRRGLKPVPVVRG